MSRMKRMVDLALLAESGDLFINREVKVGEGAAIGRDEHFDTFRHGRHPRQCYLLFSVNDHHLRWWLVPRPLEGGLRRSAS